MHELPPYPHWGRVLAGAGTRVGTVARDERSAAIIRRFLRCESRKHSLLMHYFEAVAGWNA